MARRKKVENEQLLILRAKQMDLMSSMNRSTREIPVIDDRLELLSLAGEINNKISKFIDLREKVISR